MVASPSLELRIYPSCVRASGPDLDRIKRLLDRVKQNPPRETVVLDADLQPKQVRISPYQDEVRQIRAAVQARLQCTREWKIDQETAEVWILESKNNLQPKWLKLKPIWSDGRFTGVVRDEKGRDVRVEVVEVVK